MNTEEEFKAELRALLRKYSVSMSIEECSVGCTAEISFFRYGKNDWNDVDTINWNTRWEDGNTA